jgi:hypothetical protein
MPIYECACRACGHEFETARCASPQLEKKLSVVATSGREAEAVSACATCGHRGGPGSCSLN